MSWFLALLGCLIEHVFVGSSFTIKVMSQNYIEIHRRRPVRPWGSIWGPMADPDTIEQVVISPDKIEEVADGPDKVEPASACPDKVEWTAASDICAFLSM